MTTGLVKTQGTHIYFVDNTTSSDGTVTRLVCPTGVSDGGGSKDDIEVTCLDALEDKEFVSGLGNPGDWSIAFNLVPRDGSHQALWELKRTGAVIDWMAALSESDTAPTLGGSGNLIAPTDRSSFKFPAYVKDVVFDMSTNEIVRGTITLRRAGAVVPYWYEPA